MDAGIATRANLGLLHGRGQHWITVRRGGAAPPGRDPDIVMETRAGYEARAWKLSASEEEIELCIWSKARQDKDDEAGVPFASNPHRIRARQKP